MLTHDQQRNHNENGLGLHQQPLQMETQLMLQVASDQGQNTKKWILFSQILKCCPQVKMNYQ